MKREIPLALLFVVGILLITDRFINVPAVSSLASNATSWAVIVSGFALSAAALNLIFVHVRRIQRKENAFFSGALLISLAVMAGIGIFIGTSSEPFAYIYQYLMAPMNATMFAMLAFYIASAAYRAFVARNLDATVLLVSAVIVMLDQVGLGKMLFPGYGSLASWWMNYPNMAGQRGLMIGAAIGAMTISLRVLVGIDRTHFGGGFKDA